MRIILKFRPFGNQVAAFLPVSMEIDSLNVLGTVEFLIDTGANKVILSKTDAEKLGIPYTNYAQSTAYGVGHAPIREINEEVKILLSPTLPLNVKASTDQIEVLEQDDAPSLLGLDFLRSLNLRLVYDAATMSAYLEF